MEVTGILNSFYWPNHRPRLCWCQDQNTLSSRGGWHRQCIITRNQSNYYCDETNKMAMNSQSIRAMINPPPVGPQWAHSKTNTRQWPINENFLPRSSLCLTLAHREFHAFLITKWLFPSFSMTKLMQLKLPHWNADLSRNSNFCDFRFWPFQIK